MDPDADLPEQRARPQWLWYVAFGLVVLMLVNCHLKMTALEMKVQACGCFAVSKEAPSDSDAAAASVAAAGAPEDAAENAADEAETELESRTSIDVIRDDAAALSILSRQKRNANADRTPKPRTTKPPKPPKSPTSAFHMHMHIRTDPDEHKAPVQPGSAQGYIYKFWRPDNWTHDTGKDIFSYAHGRLTVKQKGLYFIYAQILYFNSAARSSYVIMVDNEMFIQCWTSVDHVVGGRAEDNARYKTCYTGAVRRLNKNQTVWVKELYGNYIFNSESSNFFGVLKLADAA